MIECTRFDALEAVNSEVKLVWDVTPSSLLRRHQKLCVWKQHNLVSTNPKTGRYILEDSNFNTRIKYEVGLQRKLPFVIQK